MPHSGRLLGRRLLLALALTLILSRGQTTAREWPGHINAEDTRAVY